MLGGDQVNKDKTRLKDLPVLGRRCIFSEFLFGVCYGAWSIAMNFYLAACGINETQIGTLLCLGYLVTAITSFFVGTAGDKYGFPLVMAVGTFLMGASLILVSNVQQLCLFYLGHGIYCAGLGCVMSMEFNLPLSLVKESQRQYSYNLVLAIYFLGSIAGSALCSICLPLFPAENPYRYILMLCAGLYMLLTWFRGRLPRQPANVSHHREHNGVWILLRKRSVRYYLVYGFLTFGLLTLSTGMLNLVLRLWHGMSDRVVGIVFSLNSVAGCAILLLLPAVVRRIELHQISKVTFLLQVVAFVVMTFAPGGLFVGMTILRTATCNILYTSVDSPMLQSVPQQWRGSYAGMRIFSNYIGTSAASMLSGWLIGLKAFQSLFILCAVVACVQILIYQFLCSPFLRRQSIDDLNEN
ncbi:MFS transporter [Pseudoflavonifractor sp. AF19-9AC]|nr:MFS transporter [Pseudoflavonifractor sp. AF19-9AC]